MATHNAVAPWAVDAEIFELGQPLLWGAMDCVGGACMRRDERDGQTSRTSSELALDGVRDVGRLPAVLIQRADSILESSSDEGARCLGSRASDFDLGESANNARENRTVLVGPDAGIGGRSYKALDSCNRAMLGCRLFCGARDRGGDNAGPRFVVGVPTLAFSTHAASVSKGCAVVMLSGASESGGPLVEAQLIATHHEHLVTIHADHFVPMVA